MIKRERERKSLENCCAQPTTSSISYISVISLLISSNFSAGSAITVIKIEIPNIRRIIIANYSLVMIAFLIIR